jgi:hypothetical protein
MGASKKKKEKRKKQLPEGPCATKHAIWVAEGSVLAAPHAMTRDGAAELYVQSTM